MEALTMDQALPGGWWYSQTGVPGEAGFPLVDDAGAQFWSEFRRLGGVDALGYPVSQRFQLDGFTVQATQRVLMQWRPESNSVMFVNVFDRLHDLGQDAWLLSTRQTPPSTAIDDSGKTWEQIVLGRMAILDQYPLIKAKFQAVVGDPIQVNGLPTSMVTDMGNHFALRSQRVVIQQWKEKVPWANPGDVTVALGGDISKETGLVPKAASRPTLAPGAVGTVPNEPPKIVHVAPVVTTAPVVATVDTLIVTSPLSSPVERYVLTAADAGSGFRTVDEALFDSAALAGGRRDPSAYAAQLSGVGFARGFRRSMVKENGTKATVVSTQVDLFRTIDDARTFWRVDAKNGWTFNDPSVRVESTRVSGIGEDIVAFRFVSGESAARGFLVIFRRSNAIATVYLMAQVAFPTLDETLAYASTIDRRLRP